MNAKCPICLDFMQLPFLTSCGHSFCLRCLIKNNYCLNFHNKTGVTYEWAENVLQQALTFTKNDCSVFDVEEILDFKIFNSRAYFSIRWQNYP